MAHFCIFIFWWQCEASKTLLAVMESRTDSEMADRILLKMNQPTQLVCLCACVRACVRLCVRTLCNVISPVLVGCVLSIVR